MKKSLMFLLCFSLALVSPSVLTAATMTALSTFGGGDGWVSPSSVPKLGTGSLERGMAYNPVTKNVLFVSRDAGVFVEILDGETGTKVGNLDVTGITGGTFALSSIGVGSDGAIYAANLTTNSTTSAYKIYRWADETSVPTVAFSGATAAARIGDTFDVIGSGANTRIIAGHNTGGFNNFSLFTTADGTNFTGSSVAIASNPPAAQAFHLGITFTDSDTVLGRGVSNVTSVVDINATGNAGTLVASNTLAPGSTLRPMDYTVLGNGIPVWAVLQSAGNSLTPGSNSRLFVYDLSDPNNPVEIAQKNNTLLVPANANGNNTGAVAFGKTTYRKAIIYAMDTNNGIQAFELVTVPEPTSVALLSITLATMGLMRSRRE